MFAGDEGISEPSRSSRRYGFEWTNYYSPRPWLTFDLDASWSHSRFTEFDAAGPYIPEAVGTVVSAGASLENLHRIDGAIRWRYFGPRTLTEDNSHRSQATSIVNLTGGYRLATNVRLNLETFNAFNSADADVDYFYVSRLPGEPLGGFADLHTHPTIPRTARLSIHVGF